MKYLMLLPSLFISTVAVPSNTFKIEELMHYTNPSIEEAEVQEYTKLILAYSEQYAVDPKLVASVIAVESSFDADAEGPFGEVGLMQLRPKFYGNKKELAKPRVNVKIGVQFLQYLKDKFGPVYKDIRYVEHYNCGAKAHPKKFKYTKRVSKYYRLLGGV